MTLVLEAWAIMDRLTHAGLDSDAIHAWWRRRVPELGELSPREAALLGAGPEVLAFADYDVERMAAKAAGRRR